MSDNGHNLEMWPASLLRLAEIVGPDLALRLGEECGGQEKVYVPKSTATQHPWRQVLGDGAWARVVAELGGERIDLARGTHVKVRKPEILALAEQGLSHRAIARRVRVGERYVRRVLEGLTIEDKSQLKLKLF